MLVQMLKMAAGPAGVYREGERWELSDELAQAFIAVGAAVSRETPAVVEDATVAPAETAMLQRSKRGRK